MSHWLGTWQQLQGQTPLRLVVVSVLVLVDVGGIVAILLGDTGLGGTLVTFGCVSLAPYAWWMRKTAAGTVPR